MEVLLEKLDRKVDEMRMTYQKMYKENQQLRNQAIQLDEECKKYQAENFDLNDRLQKIEARLFKMVSNFEKDTLGYHHEINEPKPTHADSTNDSNVSYEDGEEAEVR